MPRGRYICINHYNYHEMKPCPQSNKHHWWIILSALMIALNPALGRAQAGNGSTTIHFRPDDAKAGDVIPFYHQGTYHVFYMRESNWGHIASEDLVNWRILPDAITKGQDSLGADGEGCWTGSIVEHQGLFYLFYTGKNSKDPKGDQKVMMATSKDLVRWVKAPQHTFYADGNIYWNKTMNGSIDDKLDYHHQAFRDPDVFWNEERSEWWMLLHATLTDGTAPAMGLYTSKDIINWKPSKPLLVYPAEISGDCPFIFPSKGKWFLNFADYHYLTADNLEGPYEETAKAFDCGDLRVPKIMWDGRRFILVGWILDYHGEVDSGKPNWGGTLCMPRELWTDSLGNEFQRPAQEILTHFQSIDVRRSEKFVTDQRIDIPADFMFHAQLKAKTPQTTLTVRFPQEVNHLDSGYHLKIDFQSREIELGSHYKSYRRICDFDPEGMVDVRIFMLGDVLECFINDAWAFTMRAYGKRNGDMSISIQDGAINISKYEVFKPTSL